MESRYDGFGVRSRAIDPESGDALDVLSFAPALVAAPEFASAVGERVARLARVRHTFYARARRLDWPAADALQLASDYIPGWRLSEVLRIVEREKLTLDIGVVLALMRQLIPAVALFSRHQRDAAIGTIGVERLILTPQSRLILAEYVLAPGVETLQYPRERLWRELRVALPPAASAARIPPSADVVAIGVVAVSLLLGRLLRDDEYLVSLGELFGSLTESNAGTTKELSQPFCAWISRALQFDEHSGFQTPHEAQLAFEEMLAKQRDYMTTPAQLELFVSRFEKLSSVAPVDRPPALSPPSAPDGIPLLADRPPSPPPPDPGPPSPDPHDVPAVRFRLDTGGRKWLTSALAGLAVLALVEAGVIAWLLTRDTGTVSSGQGDLVIQSRPAAARVTIDGEERGLTPLTTSLSPGAHILEIRVGRSEPRVLPVQIRGGVQNGIYVELLSVSTVGGLDVRTNPPNARVTVDGQFRGTTPVVLRDLPPGDHEVLIEGSGRQVRQTVRIEPGITSQLVVPLGR